MNREEIFTYLRRVDASSWFERVPSQVTLIYKDLPHTCVPFSKTGKKEHKLPWNVRPGGRRLPVSPARPFAMVGIKILATDELTFQNIHPFYWHSRNVHTIAQSRKYKQTRSVVWLFEVLQESSLGSGIPAQKHLSTHDTLFLSCWLTDTREL